MCGQLDLGCVQREGTANDEGSSGKRMPPGFDPDPPFPPLLDTTYIMIIKFTNSKKGQMSYFHSVKPSRRGRMDTRHCVPSNIFRSTKTFWMRNLIPNLVYRPQILKALHSSASSWRSMQAHQHQLLLYSCKSFVGMHLERKRMKLIHTDMNWTF